MNLLLKIILGLGVAISLYFAFIGLFYWLIGILFVVTTMFIIGKIKNIGKPKSNTKIYRDRNKDFDIYIKE